MDTDNVSFYEAIKLKYIYLSELEYIKGAVFMKSAINIVYVPKLK
jgi:hypothetical protein